jgi:hypothetical protein
MNIPRWQCACGLEATIAANVFRPGQPPERLLLCSVDCPTVRGATLDVVLAGADFTKVMGPGTKPCWCPHTAGKGILVPVCPQHGRR